MKTITIDDIIQEYGDYYLNSGQNLSRLHSALRQPSATLTMFGTRIFTRDTVYQMANPVFQSIIQPFRKAFEPIGGVEFFPNEIRLRQIKVDSTIDPHDIEDSWLGFLAGDSSRNLQDWPIVKWYLEEYIAKQVQEDKELSAIYKGEYNPTGTTPTDCMDGLKKLLTDGANHPKYPINVITGIDDFTPENIFDVLEEYDRKLPEIYTNVPIIHFVAQKWVRMFKTDKRTKGFYFIESPDKINEAIDFTNHIVVGLPSMNGTNDIFSTVKQNMIHVVKRRTDTDAGSVDLQKVNRSINFLCDWWEGIGFACNKLVWTTEQTVGITSGSASGSASSSGTGS
jgi:hypothetical protein